MAVVERVANVVAMGVAQLVERVEAVAMEKMVAKMVVVRDCRPPPLTRSNSPLQS